MKFSIQSLLLIQIFFFILTFTKGKISYQKKEWVIFDHSTSNLNYINSSLIFDDIYLYNTSTNSIQTIQNLDTICDTSQPNYYSNNNAFCIAQNSDDFVHLTLNQNSDNTSSWVQDYIFSMSSQDLDLDAIQFGAGSVFSIQSQNQYEAVLVVYNLTNGGKFVGDETTLSCGGSSYKCNLNASISSEGVLFSSKLEHKNGSNDFKFHFYSFAEKQTYDIGNATIDGSYDLQTVYTPLLLNSSQAALFPILIKDEDENHQVKIYSFAWDSDYKNVQGDVANYVGAEFAPDYIYQANDTHFIMAYSQTPSMVLEILGIFTIGSNGSLQQKGTQTLNFYAQQSQYKSGSDVIDAVAFDDKVGVYILYPKCGSYMHIIDGFYYQSVIQYYTEIMYPPIFFENGTKVELTPYGLALFDPTPNMTQFIRFKVSSAFYNPVNQTYFFILDDEQCKILALDVRTFQASPYSYGSNCGCESSNEHQQIQSAAIMSKNAKPQFVYVCSEDQNVYGQVYYMNSDGNVSAVYENEFRNIMFADYTNNNLTVLSTSSPFVFYSYDTVTDEKVDGDHLVDATTVNKVDERTVIYVTEDSDSQIHIKDLNGTYLFNETVKKSGIQTVLPLGYGRDNTKISGFLFVDNSDSSLWFYNIAEDNKLIQTGFGYSNFVARQVGNGAMIVNGSVGFRNVEYFNVTNFGLFGNLIGVSFVGVFIMALGVLV